MLNLLSFYEKIVLSYNYDHMNGQSWLTSMNNFLKMKGWVILGTCTRDAVEYKLSRDMIILFTDPSTIKHNDIF